MIDLSILKDRWTVDGAREVFAQLVTQCVRVNHPGARAIRPDPGDQGVDTFAGEFNKDVRVWQAKFFCNGIGETQQKEIRDSWKTCMKSGFASRVTMWTLCVPCDLSIKEEKWWQAWRARESSKTEVPIELWTKTHFASFSRRKELGRVFGYAMQRDGAFESPGEVVAAMVSALPRLVEKLPSEKSKHLLSAVFVRKLEAAGIMTHRAARSAFYNFELLRNAIEGGGTKEERTALEDMQERVYDLWESLYNAHFPAQLGRPLFNAVEAEMKQEDGGRLATSLNVHLVHKKGGLHHWADLCQAGWTADHERIGAEGASEDEE